MSSHSQASEHDIESSQAPERHIWSSPSQDPERDIENDSGEFSSAIRDRPFVGNSSVTVTHFNLTFEAPLEVVVTLKEGVLDPAKSLEEKSVLAEMEENLIRENRIGGAISRCQVALECPYRNRSATWLNLSLPRLERKVLINGILQRVEYEYIPTICFACRQYEHVNEICSNMEPCLRENGGVSPASGESLMVDAVMVDDDRAEETCIYRPWILVERKPGLTFNLNEKGNGEENEDSPKASIKRKGSQIGIGLVVETKASTLDCAMEGQGASVLSKEAYFVRITHFILTFEVLLEVTVTLKEGVLDPAKPRQLFLRKTITQIRLSQRIGKKGDMGGLKLVEKQLEVEYFIRN
ncbi:hypothetical protein Gotur_012111 [Gossypium turneri]